ncbi:MAG: DUF4388 domain-containing protein [Planctomycetes bacterium]|nr:DUF4388 domain-containing protein [Planctomycetota bacterium]
MPLVGHTAYLGLLELVQVVELHRRDLHVALRSRDTGGYLHFQAGRVVDARVGATEGEEAFLRMAGWRESECILEGAGAPRTHSVTKSVPELLFLAVRELPADGLAATPPHWRLTGDVGSLTLVELLQVFEMNRRPSLIQVQAGGEVHRHLLVDDGQVRFPAGAGTEAEELVFGLLGQEDCGYQASPRSVPKGEGRTVPASSLILEAMRRVDERRATAAGAGVGAGAAAAGAANRVVELLRDLADGKLSVEARRAVARRYLPGGETTPVPVLLQLVRDPAPEVRETVFETIRGLSVDVLLTLLADEETPVEVLSEVLNAYPREPELQEAAVRHPRLPEALAAAIAFRADERLAEAVRASPHGGKPEVARALDARSVTKHRTDPGTRARRQGPGSSERRARRSSLSTLPLADRVYLARGGSATQQLVLATSPIVQVALAVVTSPRVGEGLLESISAMPTANSEALREIASSRQAARHRGICRNLAFNPRTPPGVVIKELLRWLPERELQTLSRSTGAAEPVRQAAQRWLRQLAARRGDVE